MTPKAVNLYTLQVVLRELGPPWGLEGKEEWLSHCILVNLARSWGVASCLVTGHWADNKGALLWFFKNDQPCTTPKRHSFKSWRAWRVARMREVHFWILRVGFAILGCFFADHHMSMNIYSQCTGTILYGLRGLFKTMFSLHFSKDDVRTISKLQAKELPGIRKCKRAGHAACLTIIHWLEVAVSCHLSSTAQIKRRSITRCDVTSNQLL